MEVCRRSFMLTILWGFRKNTYLLFQQIPQIAVN
ncbi:Uncharacterised protein [Bordetella pertussis]|nr:Uncharacterised protein [Bordetella pertussis]